MQGMPEFVEEGFHLVISQQCRLAFCRFGEIHDYRYMWTAVFTSIFYPLSFEFCHPGTGTFTFARMEIRIQYGEETSVFIQHFVSIHIFVIYRDIRVLMKRDAIQFGSQSEDSRFHFAQFEVGAEHLFVNIELPVFQFVGVVAPIPRHHFKSISLFCTG